MSEQEAVEQIPSDQTMEPVNAATGPFASVPAEESGGNLPLGGSTDIEQSMPTIEMPTDPEFMNAKSYLLSSSTKTGMNL